VSRKESDGVWNEEAVLAKPGKSKMEGVKQRRRAEEEQKKHGYTGK
jgi:hypothetical protein